MCGDIRSLNFTTRFSVALPSISQVGIASLLTIKSNLYRPVFNSAGTSFLGTGSRVSVKSVDPRRAFCLCRTAFLLRCLLHRTHVGP